MWTVPNLLIVLLWCSQSSLVFGIDYESTDVVQLTDANFDELTATGTWLLEFYAPWCAHCKSLFPHYVAAAERLFERASLGAIDCDANSELAARFEVKGFPTIKFFRDGESSPYIGSRTEDGFVEFCEKMIKPPVKEITDGEVLLDVLDDNEVVFALINLLPEMTGDFSSEKSDSIERFTKIAGKNQAVLSFVELKSTDLLPESYQNQFDVESNDDLYVVMLTLDGDFPVLKASWTEEELEEYVEANRLPLVSPINSQTFRPIMELEKRVVIAAIDYSDDHSDSMLRSMRLVAKKFNDKFVFAAIDGIRYQSWVNQFLSGPLPFVFVYNNDLGQHYLPQNGKPVSVAEIGAFVADVHAGKIPSLGNEWYSPSLWAMKFNRWKEAYFTDTQFIIIAFILVCVVIPLVFFFFCSSIVRPSSTPSSAVEKKSPIKQVSKAHIEVLSDSEQSESELNTTPGQSSPDTEAENDAENLDSVSPQPEGSEDIILEKTRSNSLKKRRPRRVD